MWQRQLSGAFDWLLGGFIAMIEQGQSDGSGSIYAAE